MTQHSGPVKIYRQALGRMGSDFSDRYDTCTEQEKDSYCSPVRSVRETTKYIPSLGKGKSMGIVYYCM